jgi:hypothetical protein
MSFAGLVAVLVSAGLPAIGLPQTPPGGAHLVVSYTIAADTNSAVRVIIHMVNRGSASGYAPSLFWGVYVDTGVTSAGLETIIERALPAVRSAPPRRNVRQDVGSDDIRVSPIGAADWRAIVHGDKTLGVVVLAKYVDDGLPAGEARIAEFVAMQSGDESVQQVVRNGTYLQHGASLIPVP